MRLGFCLHCEKTGYKKKIKKKQNQTQPFMAASNFIGGNVPPFLDRAQQEKFRQDTQRRGAAKISISYVEERWQRGVSKINDKEGDPVPIKTRTLSGYPSDTASPSADSI